MLLESSIDIHIPELEVLIAPWRSPTVEVAALGVPPHVTILWPWRNAPVTSEDITGIADVLKNIEPLTLVFDQLKVFPNGTIYLAMQNAESVQSVTKEIVTAFPDCPPYRGEFADPVPHVTVAKAKNEEEKIRFCTELSEILRPHMPMTIHVKEFVLMEQRENLRWEIRATIPLGGG